MENFYLTTTLPYVNGLPHSGTALEFVQADVIARYMRMVLGKEKVFFNIGTDEHGLKIYTKAKEEGLDPQAYVDKFVVDWKEFCRLYGISYDNFYRTTDPEHIRKSQILWNQLMADGQIYKKKYKGLYCVGCEAFKTEKELVNGKCPDHGTVPIEMEEENYFLRLSDHSQAILDYIKEKGVFVKNEEKQNHLVNFLKEGLQDISISRVKEKLPWGIDVPGDEKQVMYVWLEALMNYVIAVGYPDDEKRFQSFWPAVQICGPDNVKFQGAIWQGILHALKLPFTKLILGHGMINAEDGTKMSKTKGNVISPFDLLHTYGLEAVRYYLILGVPTFDDVAFSYGRLTDLYNDGLADKYGNLLNRIIHLAKKYDVDLKDHSSIDPELQKRVTTTIERYRSLMNEFELSQAFQEIYDLSMYGNEYITVKKPWDASVPTEEKKVILQSVGYLVETLIDSYEPVLIESTPKARKALKTLEPIILFKKLE